MSRWTVDRSSRRGADGRRVAGAALVGIVLVGCSQTGPSSGPTSTATVPSALSPSTPADTSGGPTPRRSRTCTDAQVVSSWPLERLAAEVVTVPVLDFDLAAVTSEVRDGVGGVLFLGSSPAPTDLRTRVRTLLRAAPLRTRPLVMADEEGGGVQRLAPIVSPVPWPRDMARTLTPLAVRRLAARVGGQMSAAGVTVDLAPVADVDGRSGPSPTNPDGARSFSADAGTASRYAVAFLDGLRDGGVLPVVKHFPGLGGSTANTDAGPATTLPFGELLTTGLVPFRAAIDAGTPAVMVSNASVPGLSPLPASLSSAVIGGLLRRQLGFHALVVTDSLSAGAILTSGRTLAQAAVASIRAGADLILFGSTLTAAQREQLSGTEVRRSYTAIVSAIATAVRTRHLARGRLTAAALEVSAAAHDHLCP